MIKKKGDATQEGVSAEESKLFRETIADPQASFEDKDIEKSTSTNKSTTVRISTTVNHRKASLERGDQLSFCRPSIKKHTFKKLQRGQFKIAETLDLHDMSAAEAIQETELFLQECIDHKQYCVKIIHGKGKGSSGQPVLKNDLNNYLPTIPQVLAFHSALPRDGGTGAIYLLLKCD